MTPKQRIIPIFVPHLGCPYCCVFCNQRKISGFREKLTGEKVRRLILEGLEVKPEGAWVQAAFYGGSFTAIDSELRKELLSAVNPFIEDGSLSGLRVSTRPYAVSSEALEELKKPQGGLR
jgi:histone acetyltransferase (RNA polymerase elongator complex component)